MSTNWYQQSINALQLNGKGERTQQAYTRALRMLVEFTGKRPEAISEAELEAYFLHRRNVDRWSPNTMRICYCGIRFFFVQVLQRNWHLFQILRAKNESRLPAVLSQEEVRRVLGCVRTAHNYAFLSTVYACGLRLTEALHLEVSDIDSTRMMLHVHRGKGARDRFVPLPKTALAILRAHWKTHRNARLLFPAQGRDSRSGATADTPMAISSVQGAFRAAKRAAGIAKRGVSIHTLRHYLPFLTMSRTAAAGLVFLPAARRRVDIVSGSFRQPRAGEREFAMRYIIDNPVVLSPERERGITSETTQLYLEARLAMEERALGKRFSQHGRPARYKPGD